MLPMLRSGLLPPASSKLLKPGSAPGLGVHLGGDGGRGEVSGLAAEHCCLLVVPFAQFFERPLVHAAIPCPLST
jgi:hypothetical protein